MKNLILRLMLAMTGYAKEKRQLDKITFRIGKIPDSMEVSVWDFNHDGKRDTQVVIYYKNEAEHFDKFQFKTVQAALNECALAEKFLGKKVL